MTDAERAGKTAGELGVPGNVNNPYPRWSEDYFAWWRAFLRTGGKP